MIEQKTSFHIWNDVEVNKNNKTISEFNKEVWVRADQILKEILKEKEENKKGRIFMELDFMEQGFDIALDYVLSLICNSREQTDFGTSGNDCGYERSNLSSVSCDAKKTGEDKSSNVVVNASSKSFPVQIPKKCTCKKDALDKLIVKNKHQGLCRFPNCNEKSTHTFRTNKTYKLHQQRYCLIHAKEIKANGGFPLSKIVIIPKNKDRFMTV